MTRNWRADVAAVIAGLVAGIIVLGVGGRLAMAALPMLSGTRSAFSWGGSLEVVLLGAVYGLAGGVVLSSLQRLKWPRAAYRGILLGLVLLGVAWASSSVGRSTARGAPVSVPVVILISAVTFLGYGVVADALARRWSGDIANDRSRTW